MAKFMRSILGRNAKPTITNMDIQTAKDNGITSKRGIKKNLGDIRQAQYQNQGTFTHPFTGEVTVKDGFGPFGEVPGSDPAVGQRLAAAGFKDQNRFGQRAKNYAKSMKPTEMPSAKGMFGIYD